MSIMTRNDMTEVDQLSGKEEFMPAKILVVDDEQDICTLISGFLSGEGYTVITAENGEEGLRRFKEESPDLVITDIKMPGRNGIDLLKDVKAADPSMDVIVLTGHSDELTAIDCLHCGAYDYLLKPLEELDLLLASIQRAIQKRQLEARNLQLVKELEEMAIRDPLTGIYNHRHMHTCLSDEIARALRYEHPFSVMMIDIDHFKQVNDTYGHLVGDFVLKRMVHLLEEQVRLTDTLFRYGGEEFLILLPETEKYEATLVADRLLDAIRNHPFDCDGHRVNITISIGASVFPEEARDVSTLIGVTDRRLYRAKKMGRNRHEFVT
jgi:diguanylate cyclase (GGDEF)-like protein